MMIYGAMIKTHFMLFNFFVDILDSLRPVSPKPALSHVERAKTPLNDDTSHTADAEDQRSERRFLKINVRHITDGQVD